ncbi:MAG: fibronectin type III domain-containing protein [Deltaproteobacteria bacterium]|nr:fibronectin type III domain-containing protein [Deltaproteobacteria bacterium]
MLAIAVAPSPLTAAISSHRTYLDCAEYWLDCPGCSEYSNLNLGTPSFPARSGPLDNFARATQSSSLLLPESNVRAHQVCTPGGEDDLPDSHEGRLLSLARMLGNTRVTLANYSVTGYQSLWDGAMFVSPGASLTFSGRVTADWLRNSTVFRIAGKDYQTVGMGEANALLDRESRPLPTSLGHFRPAVSNPCPVFEGSISGNFSTSIRTETSFDSFLQGEKFRFQASAQIGELFLDNVEACGTGPGGQSIWDTEEIPYTFFRKSGGYAGLSLDGHLHSSGQTVSIPSGGHQISLLGGAPSSLFVKQPGGQYFDRQSASPASSHSITVPLGGTIRIVLATDTNTVARLSLTGVAASRPSVPRNFGVVAGDRSLTMTWTPPDQDGGSPIQEYQACLRSIDLDTCWTVSGGASARSFTRSGLTNGTTYYASVVARNAVGFGSPTLEQSATPSGGGCTSAPGLAQSVTTVPGNSSVTLSWNPPAAPCGSTVTKYTYAYSIAGSSSWTYRSTSNGSTRSVGISGLIQGTSYEFKVRASNSHGHSGWTPIVIGTPGGGGGSECTSAPGLAGSVTTVPGSGNVTLSWNPPAAPCGSTVTKYTYAYSVAGVNSWTYRSTPNGSTRSVGISGLSNGTSYRFKVRATNGHGHSGWTPVVFETPGS